MHHLVAFSLNSSMPMAAYVIALSGAFAVGFTSDSWPLSLLLFLFYIGVMVDIAFSWHDAHAGAWLSPAFANEFGALLLVSLLAIVFGKMAQIACEVIYRRFGEPS